MTTSRRGEAGETLLEIVIALVIIGLVLSVLFGSISMSASSSTTHRDVVRADAALRDAAELTKSQVRKSCQSAGSTYSVDYSTMADASALVAAGFTLPAAITNQSCPPVTGLVTAQVPPVVLSVRLPQGKVESLTILVRTPGTA